MATMVTSGGGAPLASFREIGGGAATNVWPAGKAEERRRDLSPQAGKAIEKLGHAIEYLYDEFTLESISGRSASDFGLDPKIAAIDLLKRLNREIYLSCPIVPTLRQRLRMAFKLKASDVL